VQITGAKLAIWKNSTGTSYRADGKVFDFECEVRIDTPRIVVSYEDERPTTYEGEEKSPGHFKLECPSKKGRATLHQMPGDDILEGYWIEDGYEGMWRIQLEEE
jgi:hypothetical protein